MEDVKHSPLFWVCPTCRCRSFARPHVEQPDGTYAPGKQWILCVGCKATYEAPEIRAALVDALNGLLDRYVSLANSGDCGFWNPEEEPQVIAARTALQLAGEK